MGLLDSFNVQGALAGLGTGIAEYGKDMAKTKLAEAAAERESRYRELAEERRFEREKPFKERDLSARERSLDFQSKLDERRVANEALQQRNEAARLGVTQGREARAEKRDIEALSLAGRKQDWEERQDISKTYLDNARLLIEQKKAEGKPVSDVSIREDAMKLAASMPMVNPTDLPAVAEGMYKYMRTGKVPPPPAEAPVEPGLWDRIWGKSDPEPRTQSTAPSASKQGAAAEAESTTLTKLLGRSPDEVAQLRVRFGLRLEADGTVTMLDPNGKRRPVQGVK